MSRAALVITAAFFVVAWPTTVALSVTLHCGSSCIREHGEAMIELAVGALITSPVAALSFISAEKLRRIAAASERMGTRRAGRAATIVLLVFFAGLSALAVFMWTYAGAVFLSQMSGGPRFLNSIPVAAFISIYSAAVCGGSWMALIGARKMQADADAERAARLEMFR